MQPRDFGFGDDEAMLRDSARKFLSDTLPVDKLRRLVAADHVEAYESATPPLHWDESLWQRIVELGWTSLAVPEEAGGAGMKMVAVAALAEEAGRVALPSPLIATLVATCVLREAGTAAASAALERIAAGAAASLAITNAQGSWEPGDTDVAAADAGGGAVKLSGTACFVQDARKAGFFVVAARSAAGVGLYRVDADAPGVTIHADHIVDLTRDQARVELAGVAVAAGDVVAAAGEGDAVLARATPAMLVIVAADLCGAAEWQLQTTAEYARVRTQFDHPLGFFQAVKHPIVNMMIDIDRARSLVYAAACDIDSGDDAEVAARMAKSAAADTAAFASNRSVQLHGGIGFTWECDVHIYFKRQMHNQMLYGDAVYQRRKLGDLL